MHFLKFVRVKTVITKPHANDGCAQKNVIISISQEKKEIPLKSRHVNGFRTIFPKLYLRRAYSTPSPPENCSYHAVGSRVVYVFSEFPSGRGMVRPTTNYFTPPFPGRRSSLFPVVVVVVLTTSLLLLFFGKFHKP